MFLISMKAGLKRKEFIYILCETYLNSVLKHSHLDLINKNISKIITPHDEMLEKLKYNLKEVNANGDNPYLLENKKAYVTSQNGFLVIKAIINVVHVTAHINLNILILLVTYYSDQTRLIDVELQEYSAKLVTIE